MEESLDVSSNRTEEHNKLALQLRTQPWTVYVGNLSIELSYSDVFIKLSRYGSITCLHYPRSNEGLGMGYAVVSYDDEFSAIKAARRSNGRFHDNDYLYGACSIDTGYMALTTRSLYVSNLSVLVNESILRAVFNGKGEIESVVFKWNVFGCRYAIVTFALTFCAQVAAIGCNGIDIGDGFPWQIHHSHDPDKDGPVSPQQFRKQQLMRRKVGYVLISEHARTVTERELYELFSFIGNVQEAIILRCYGRPIGYSIVKYDTQDVAFLAIRRLNGYIFHGLRLKLQHIHQVWQPFHDSKRGKREKLVHDVV